MIQGSGWGWLAFDAGQKALRIIDLANQEMLAPAGLTPILSTCFSSLAVDVWEHAYYVDYKNLRLDYVKQIWKVINWSKAEKRFLDITTKK